MHEAFRRLCCRVSDAIGSPWGFVIAFATVLVWAISGPIFHYSDGWQLAINTSTTIVTFLVVFLIQNSQNHDTRAIHLKLDELLRAVANARTNLVDLEDLTDAQLKQLQQEFSRMRQEVQ